MYRRLAELIGRGEFAEGSKLPPETELAERFGVSRPVVREALSRLREAGIVVSRKGSGSFVQRRQGGARQAAGALEFAPISSLAQVKKCFDFRLGIEGEAAYLAAENRTASLLQAIHEALARIEHTIAHQAIGADADYAFHLAVATASGNEFFEGIMRSLRAPIEFAINLSRSLSLTRPIEHLRLVHAEHVAIAEAIEAREAEAARTAMRLHIASTCSRVFDGPSR